MASLHEQFACQCRWPALEEATLLESIVRAGVEQGHWCLFRMGNAEEVRPEHCFSRESEADPSTVERWVANAIAEEGATDVSQVVRRVQGEHGEVPEQTAIEPVQHVVETSRAMTFDGEPEQPDRPPRPSV